MSFGTNETLGLHLNKVKGVKRGEKGKRQKDKKRKEKKGGV
jgi:hypothetical protein